MGTVKFSALMTPHQEIYNRPSAKTWRVSQSGAFPSKDYKVTSAVINFDIRNLYNGNRHMKVYRVDNGKDTELGDVPTNKSGANSEPLSADINYEGITTIKLDGVERWACQLRGGSYVEIVVTYEDAAPTVVQPKKTETAKTETAKPTTTGTEKKKDIVNYAREASASISIEGVDISKTVNEYLLSVSYTDNEEDEADDIQIKLQDKDGDWLKKWLNDIVQKAAASKYEQDGRLTAKGLKITASLSISDPSGKVQKMNCGSFELDNLKASGPPSSVTIKGTSLPYGNGVRTEERDKAWEGYTVSKIGKEIATKAGLGFLYDAPKDPLFTRLEQAKQTDIAFLMDVCHRNGLSLKVSDNKLIIFDQSRYEAQNPIIVISWMDGSYTKYDLSTQEGDVQYAACTVKYYHPEKNQTFIGTAYADDYEEDNEDNLTLTVTNERVNSPAEAKDLAEKLLRLHNKYEKRCSLTMIGNPLLCAGMTVQLKDFGLWGEKFIIKQCKHEIGTSGYTTKITLRAIPDKNVAKTEKEPEQSGGGNGGNRNNGNKTWQIVNNCVAYKAATGLLAVGSLSKGTPITILGSTAGSRVYISGGGVTGYVNTYCIGKV